MEEKDREKIEVAIQASENDFEKNLVYLSAGSLTLSIGFIEKIVPLNHASGTCLIIISWCVLALTLLLNLSTHLISASNGHKARYDMDSGMDYDKLISKMTRRNIIMQTLNWITFGLFSMGIILTVVFCSINLINHV